MKIHSTKRGVRLGALSAAVLVPLFGMLPVAAAKADRVDRACEAAMPDWQPRAAVEQMAQEQGWSVRRIKIDDGCYEIYGKDAEGRQIEVTLNPATLKVVKFEYERFHR